MNTFARRALLAFLGGIATAQSPLTTFLAGNNSGNVGGAVLFDLAVVAPLTITAIDINSPSLGVNGTLEVRICPATRVGNEMNPSVWTVASTGNPLVTQGSDAPTPCPLSPPIQLAPGTYGVLLKADTWAHRYTNGIGSNQVHANNELTLTAGAAQNTVFTTLFQPRVFNGSLHYVVGPDVAIGTPYGRGCYEHSRSFYERFPTSAAFDLANSAMTLVFTGSQYVGIGAGTWRAPTAAATTLAVSTVAEATVVLPRPLPFPGGSTSQLVVHPFGFVSTTVGNPGFTIDVNAWLQSPSPRWGDWQTLDPNLPGSGPLLFELQGNLAIITWNGVLNGAGGSGNWFQMQFNLNDGFVTFAWQTVSGVGGPHLVGFAAGGPSNDLGSLDLSTALAVSFATSPTDAVAVRHRADRPVLGTTANLWAERLNGGTVGAIGIGLGQFPLGLDLGGLGALGCSQYSTLETNVLVAAGPNGRLTWPVAVPPAPTLAGVHLYSQAAILVPGRNNAGLLTSNGIDLRLHVR